MSILNGPNRNWCSIAPTFLSRLHYQCTLNREGGARIRMNVAANQEKENEDVGKREAGEEERKQSTDFREGGAALLGSFNGQHGEKMACVRGVPEVTGTLKQANSGFGPTQTG